MVPHGTVLPSQYPKCYSQYKISVPASTRGCHISRGHGGHQAGELRGHIYFGSQMFLPALWDSIQEDVRMPTENSKGGC